jgi:catechol 2,3-dioxygenase-like lactoylglutathione lyase family enzyme
MPGMTEPADYGLRRLHHVQVSMPPGGEERSRAFWEGLLGLTEVAKPPELAARGGCWFRRGDLELHVGVEQEFRPARKAHPALLVAGLPVLAERLEAAGVRVTWDGAFPGHDRFYADDPFGNRVEFLEPSA